MAEVPNRVLPTALTTSAAVILTAGGAGAWTIVRRITVANVTSVPVNVTIGVDANSGAIADATSKQIYSGATVQGGASMTLDGFEIVLIGHASTPDRIYAYASAASSLNIYIPYVSGP